MKSLYLCAGIISAFIAAATSAHAKEFKDWSTFEKDGRCWASTEPNFSSSSIKRGKPYLSIQNFPEEGVEGSVSIVSGTKETAAADITIDVDGKKYDALPFENAAFTASGKPEAKLISSMLRGRELRVTWKMPSGQEETDIYSLMGFSAAKREIDRACR